MRREAPKRILTGFQCFSNSLWMQKTMQNEERRGFDSFSKRCASKRFVHALFIQIYSRNDREGKRGSEEDFERLRMFFQSGSKQKAVRKEGEGSREVSYAFHTQIDEGF